MQHVVFGQVLQAGQGQIPSRQAQIKGGIPKEILRDREQGVRLRLRSAGMVDQSVRAGDLEVAVAGGMESMSNAPYLLKQARFGSAWATLKALDGMVHDGLTNPFTGKHMGEEADEVGEELEITRADMDKFALRSHELAIQATDEGRLPEEITPVTISSKKGDSTVEIDEAPRRESTLEALSALRGAFHKDGAHTAGNAPGVNDGAGALVLSSDEWAKSNGRTPMATIVAQAAVADDFLSGPHARQRGEQGAREGRAVGGRHRPVRDQRGLCLGGAQLDAHARRGRVEGERERRRDRARAPDRRERRPHPDDARPRAAPRGGGPAARQSAPAAARATLSSSR